ncbi:NADP-dependent oxidoreductase domain-containing protein [Lanmaoa asiatica]|nr:NADP-dependent oxidoreductase domain-containing protein [Lanmaoa asiatica]
MPISTLTLNDGTHSPWIAFGTGTALYNKDATTAITIAIQNGFTHLDGAQIYGNENTLGDGIVASGKPRSELYITTKLGALAQGATPTSALEESLKKLGMAYVDLYLIHSPGSHVGKLKEVWKGMEEAKKAGLTKSIGVSNFTADHLKDILEVATIRPAVNQQVEAHPYVWKALGPTLAIHEQYGIVTSSYAGLSPLFRGKGGPLDPVVEQVRARLEATRVFPVSDSQVLNKWLQQKGVLVVTTSSKVERIREYIDTENVPKLMPEEIELIETTGAKLYKRFFKHSNPTSYHAHVDWWQRTVEDLVSRGWQTETTGLNKGSRETDAQDVEPESQSNKLVFGARRAIVDRLRFDGVGKPLGLASTIVRAPFPFLLLTETDGNALVKTELQLTRVLVPLSQFLTSQQSVYDPGWLPYRIASFLVGKPLWWAMEQLDIVRSEDAYSEAEMWKRVEGEYVLLKLVERAADTVDTSLGGLCLADRLYTVASFRKAFGSKVLPGVSLSETDTRVLLRYLERDRRVLVQDKDVVKFVTDDHDREVTAIDKGILELKTAAANLQDQVDRLHGKVEETTKRISTALRQQQKSIALAHLRFKKNLEEVLTKRLGALQNLEATLMSVETAAGDIEIMKTYEKSTATLQAILSHSSLRREKIDETMDALAAANANAREVDEAIKIGGDIAAAEAGVADDADLEDELNELVKETEREKAEATMDRLSGVKVPTQTPEEGQTAVREVHVQRIAA